MVVVVEQVFAQQLEQELVRRLVLGLALVVFVAMTLGFEMYFRIAGRKYEGLLGQYRKEHSVQKDG